MCTKDPVKSTTEFLLWPIKFVPTARCRGRLPKMEIAAMPFDTRLARRIVEVGSHADDGDAANVRTNCPIRLQADGFVYNAAAIQAASVGEGGR
ncbi:hypothetical protein [Jiella pelagia]|uniref:Uncharacterized protein n=1 Tax=Jiella pelagia TaxID=2986949 RepID=A0ABY7C0S2_9HYPH|nr:hypothetical protein [Jiella pelagia]WAP68368.1 hypothetical protein OH818_24045 [Jiella pelagia]